jgi:DGQHR domain-containing protein
MKLGQPMNGKYISVKLLRIDQYSGHFFVGKMKASDLLEVFTVHVTEYDETKYRYLRAQDEETFKDRLTYNANTLEDISQKGFQRTADKDRVKKIAEFLNKKGGMFPNSIIATCDLIDIPDDTIDHIPHGNLSYLIQKDNDECLDQYELRIPREKKAVVIIDGQHRLLGVKDAEFEVIENTELLVSFIIDVPRSIVASHFYKINYTQRSVNPSILKHLYAEFSDTLDEVTFLHEVASFLNENENSPFRYRIKMLGVVDSSFNKELQTLSQSIIIDYLLYTVKNIYRINGKLISKPKFPPIFLYYYKEKQGVLALRFIIRFFKAIQQLFGNEIWEKSVLCKSMGFAALSRLMCLCFLHFFQTNSLANNPDAIDSIKVKDIANLLSGVENSDLTRFEKTSSAGGINLLLQEFLTHCKSLPDVTSEEYFRLRDPFWSWTCRKVPFDPNQQLLSLI